MFAGLRRDCARTKSSGQLPPRTVTNKTINLYATEGAHLGALSSSTRSSILAHLRTLRESLAEARDSLMHYRDDRIDRDKLEPAARRVDDLMNMFAGGVRDMDQGSAWITEIRSGTEQVTNPKAAAPLDKARADIAALLEVMVST